MKTFHHLATSSAMLLLLSSPAAMHAQYAPQGPPSGYGARGNSFNAPSEYNETQRRGYQDGMEGAKKDYENHRKPDVNNRDEYRNPKVPKGLRNDYRQGFQRGYDDGVRSFVGRR